MAQDATGTPTSLGIPKYNTAADSPSGKGFNAAMDAIDSLIVAKSLPTGVTNGAVIWNGSAWVSAKITNDNVATNANIEATKIAGGLTRLFDSTLGAANSFDFSSIPSTYVDLEVVVTGRGSHASAEAFAMRFNNDSGSNYDYIRLQASSTSVSSADIHGVTSLEVGVMPGTTNPASSVGTTRIRIFNYAGTTFNKGFLSNGSDKQGSDASGPQSTRQWSGQWRSTAAINRIQIFHPTGSTFLAGTRCTIYGVG